MKNKTLISAYLVSMLIIATGGIIRTESWDLTIGEGPGHIGSQGDQIQLEDHGPNVSLSYEPKSSEGFAWLLTTFIAFLSHKYRKNSKVIERLSFAGMFIPSLPYGYHLIRDLMAYFF